MHTGLGLSFQALDGKTNDADVYREELALVQRYARSTVEHYEFQKQEFGAIEGYEYYAGLARNIGP